jgi:hypothetical protein
MGDQGNLTNTSGSSRAVRVRAICTQAGLTAVQAQEACRLAAAPGLILGLARAGAHDALRRRSSLAPGGRNHSLKP